MRFVSDWWRALPDAGRWRLLVLGALSIGAVVPSAIALYVSHDWPSLLLNFGTDMAGTFVTFILIDMIIAGREAQAAHERKMAETRHKLVQRLGSANLNVDAHRAAAELRELGWLMNGSLDGSYLDEARLEGVDLRGASLRDVRLFRANLKGAKLYGADLSRSQLNGADLSEATCGRLRLDGTHLAGVNLAGCKQLGRATLSRVHRLKGATLPDGSRYNGCFRLPGDLAQMKKHLEKKALSPDDPINVAAWYGVSFEVYEAGQRWAEKNLPIAHTLTPPPEEIE